MNAIFCLALLSSFGLSDQAPPAQKDKADETILIADKLFDNDAPDRMWNRPCKVHVVHLPANKTYIVTMTKKDNKQQLNPFFRIEDSEFKQIVGLNMARARFTTSKDDDYRFICTSNWGNGEYVLKIAPYASAKLKKHEPGKVHDIGRDGLEYDSTLAASDAKDVRRQGMFAKVFEVNLVKGKTYTVDMESTQFDAYLRLENSERQQLAEDDDSGGNLNARIIFQAPADGVYRIITTTFAPGARGNFTLRIQPN